MPGPQMQIGVKGPYETMRLCFNVYGWSFDPADTTACYFGTRAAAPTTVVNIRHVRFGMTGCIVGAVINTFSTVAGTAENISFYIRLNNTTDYLVATVGVAAQERSFVNLAMDVPISPTDFIEMKIVPPAWVTNPTGFNVWGWLIFEV